MTEESAHKIRLEDFNQRKRTNPSSVSYVPLYGWEYISVHPMSDEIELLATLHRKPEDCLAVDCYWLVSNDVVFLQVYSKHFLDCREPGLYAQWWNKNVPRLNLAAYLDDPMISRKRVEEVMLKYYEMDLRSVRFSPGQLTEHLTLLWSAKGLGDKRS